MKNLRKSIILATALFVTTGAFAYDNDNSDYKEHNSYKKNHHYNNHDKDERRSHKGDESRFFIGAVYELDLSKEQIVAIDNTIQKFKNKRFDRFNGFTEDGFDKQAYINARTETKSNKLKLKADLIEKIYTILDKSQIKQLNKVLIKFKEKNMQRGKNDSSCNDRR
jgi:protein CpxP